MRAEPTSRRSFAFWLALCMLLSLPLQLMWSPPAAATHPTGSCLDATPDSESRAVGGRHTVTAMLRPSAMKFDTPPLPTPQSPSCETVADPGPPAANDPNTAQTNATFPTQINFEFESGPNDPDGGNFPASPDFSCTIPTGDSDCDLGYQTVGVGTDVIRAWVDSHAADTTEAKAADDADSTDLVDRTTTAGTANGLDAEPETDVNQPTQTHSITATVYNEAGAPFVGTTTVNFEFFQGSQSDPDNGNSPTSPDKQCTTSSSSTCSIGYTQSGTAGIDLLCVYLGTTQTMTGNNTNGTCGGEGANDADDAEGVADPPDPANDDQDVVQKEWEVATRLDCTPETATNPAGSVHTVTCTARNSSGQTVTGAGIDVEATGANDPDGNGDRTSPDFTCTTGANGSCTLTHGSQTSTAQTQTPGATIYTAWIDSNNSNATSEADNAEGRDEAVTPGATEPDGTDVVEKTWVEEGRTIDCEPETATNPVGTTHTITCTVRGRTGQTVTGESVTFTESGPGNITSAPQQTTNSQGQATVTVSSTTEVGTQSVTGTITDDLEGAEPGHVDDCDRAAGDPAGSPAGVCSDSVSKTWTAAPSPYNLTISPQEAINRPGTEHVFTATVTNAQGQPVSGATVAWTETGQGSFVATETTTDASGQADATVRSMVPGNQVVTATALPCATGGDCTDSGTKHWGPPRCDIFGTNGPNVLRGTRRSEVICAFGGNDRLLGRGGNDLLLGGKGDDIAKGGGGNDRVRGQAGNDDLFGNGGKDVLTGAKGKDDLNGGSGKDRCSGGPGNDKARRCEKVSSAARQAGVARRSGR